MFVREITGHWLGREGLNPSLTLNVLSRKSSQAAVMTRPKMITVQPPSEMQELDPGRDVPDVMICPDLTTQYLTFREKFFYNLTESSIMTSKAQSQGSNLKKSDIVPVRFPQCSCLSIFPRINRKPKVK